jgi:signal recognition particle GTPase
VQKKRPLLVVAPAALHHAGGPLERDETFVSSFMKDPVVIEGSNGMSVVRDVLKLETGGTRVCAVGTSGIGKTTSTAILVCMLLRKGRTVV